MSAWRGPAERGLAERGLAVLELGARVLLWLVLLAPVAIWRLVWAAASGLRRPRDPL